METFKISLKMASAVKAGRCETNLYSNDNALLGRNNNFMDDGSENLKCLIVKLISARCEQLPSLLKFHLFFFFHFYKTLL